MGNLLLYRLTNFLGQLIPLIRHLSEANMDLCVFCRNNNETFEMYTSHKVRSSTYNHYFWGANDIQRLKRPIP